MFKNLKIQIILNCFLFKKDNFFSISQDISNLSIYIFISSLFAVILFSIAYFLSPKKRLGEKQSSYECGFSPFGDSRLQISIDFYLFSILFLIFDLEIIFIVPWIYCMHIPFAFFNMIVFLIILIIGFVYEWTQGALNFKKKNVF